MLYDIEVIIQTDCSFLEKDWSPLRSQGNLLGRIPEIEILQRFRLLDASQRMNSAYHINKPSNNVSIVPQLRRLELSKGKGSSTTLSMQDMSHASLYSTISAMSTSSSLDLVYPANYNEAAAILATRGSRPSLMRSTSIRSRDTQTSAADSDYGVDFWYQESCEDLVKPVQTPVNTETLQRRKPSNQI